ncbi:hypothetical protein BG015_005025 [Linnemannia schmuckeri]|uniref:FAD-binding domain-containing protein n=1 Tax=Linnemannia schmuckeri TaxID=64567 RepID=A0A9P5S3W8_9FUNG|nr:hypothetical protein BG015_005025 [Linnemannia schmuckeri]
MCSGMSIGPTLLPIFQQMGIYDDIIAAGKYMTHIYSHKESLEPYRPQDYRPIEDYTGYGHYIIARPDYYDIMLKQVPANKILFGHRVLNISEEDNRVTVHLSNNQTYEGDIIVGADGAYSAVRQRMYEQLKAKGVLPKSDHEDLPFSSTSLVGQTKVLDPEEFPIVNKPHCQFLGFLGEDKPYTWCVMSTAQKTLCWMVIHHLSKKTNKEAMEQRFRNSENSGEWGAAPAQTMCESTRNFPLQLDDGKKRTMGDLYNLTPKELISKVMLEEKVFKTWHHGRYVLMGDACHKLSPSGGHGAVTAMHDAITLANLIYFMPTKTSEDITRVFEEYKAERYPAVMESYKNSQVMGKAIEKGIVGALILFLMTRMPMWLWKLSLTKMVRYRPQVGFLPNIPLRGTVVPFVSPSEQKARELFEKQQKKTTATSV